MSKIKRSEETREEWLTHAASILNEELLMLKGIPMPTVNISVGVGKGGERKSILGQCWSKASHKEGVNQIFIGANSQDGRAAISTLVHEMLHAADDCKSGHGGKFMQWAKELGFLAPFKQTPEGPEIKKELDEIHERIVAVMGTFPHDKLNLITKKQGTRMIKFDCPECQHGNPAPVRMSLAAFDRRAPMCSCGAVYEEA